MSKVSEYLGKNLSGEVTTEPALRQYFSTDGSVLKYTPQVVVYPRTTDDIRKLTRFAWRLAEKGYQLPITPRGYGSSNTGASIGSGAVLVFPAHMQRVLELDTKLKKVRVQAGMNMRALTEVLATHGLLLPTYPANQKFASVGGALADNVSGPKSVKYGAIRSWTEKLEVVLSNGEIIQTGRISKGELNNKKGLQALEGEIYRELDALISENQELINQQSRGNVGYQLSKVKMANGSFDLTPLIVGSQGTLAIISQAILDVVPKPVDTASMIVMLPNTDDIADVVNAVLSYKPSELDYIDSGSLEWVARETGVNPLGATDAQNTAGLLFIEFDDGNSQKSKSAKKVMKMMDEFGATVELAETQDDVEDIRSVRHSISAVYNYRSQGLRPIEFSGAAVPISKTGVFLDSLRKLVAARKIDGYISGRIGVGELGVVALANLGRVGDRQAVLGFMRDYCRLAVKLGGVIAGDSGDGRMRITAAMGQYGDEMAGLFERVKEIFDPNGIFNPGVIVGTSEEELINQLDPGSGARFADYYPRI